MRKNVDIIVIGSVQGVWFRASTLERAKEFAINGYVENLPDGSLHIEAEGEDNNLQELIAWCQKGPKNAVVKQVVINFSTELKDFQTFKIKRA